MIFSSFDINISPLYAVLNTLPFGIGVAASTRVGNLIGLRSAIGAKHAAHAAAFLSVIVGAVVMITLVATRDVRLSFRSLV